MSYIAIYNNLMTNPHYMICDGNGNQLSDGIPEETIWRIAQQKANERGESVFVGASDSDETTEIAPE